MQYPWPKRLGFPRIANRYLDLSNEIRESELYKWENAMCKSREWIAIQENELCY